MGVFDQTNKVIKLNKKDKEKKITSSVVVFEALRK